MPRPIMKRFLTIPLITICALGCLPAQSRAQQPAAAAPTSDQSVATLHVQAREVLLPVTVRDKHGVLVTSLQKSDFTLTEDGRPQVIKSFTRESNLPFQVGLLVDTSRSISGAMEDERKSAGQFVDKMLPGEAKAGDAAGAAPAGGAPLPAGDQAFLLHFDREVELLQDFTGSREKLHHEIEEMGSTSRSRDDSHGPETTGDDRERPSGRGGTQLYDAIFLASDELMKPKSGRKALVIFSDGVDRGSKESMSEALDAADHANVSIYTIYFKGEQERGPNEGFPSGGHHGGMGGGGYPGGGGGYPGGGGGYPGGGGHRRDEPQVDGKKIMEQLATRTGGRFFEAKKRENLEEIYNAIAEELRGQYLLSYTPDVVDNDGGYHKVALKAAKGDLDVITREGYYAPGGESSK